MHDFINHYVLNELYCNEINLHVNKSRNFYYSDKLELNKIDPKSHMAGLFGSKLSHRVIVSAGFCEVKEAFSYLNESEKKLILFSSDDYL